MDDKNNNSAKAVTGGNSVRKRGHQHHIRNSGTRRSNVPADEVIAALRSGDHIPIKQDIVPTQQIRKTEMNRFSDGGERGRDSMDLSDIEMNLAVDTDNNNLVNHNRSLVSDKKSNDATKRTKTAGASSKQQLKSKPKSSGGTSSTCTTSLITVDCSENNRLDSLSTKRSPNVLTESTNNIQLTASDRTDRGDRNSYASTTSDLSESSSKKEKLMTTSAASSDFDMEASVKEEFDDSISISSSSSSSNLNKIKMKKTKKSSAQGNGNGSNNEKSSHRKKEKRTKTVPPNEERPPLEGADANQLTETEDVGDIENDPEAAEWLKLRCTSERTEVVAEREYRRQNRRCADYPGLAFGRSIFSSDTMMKLNIIRNELHNIMKTQLKRVCVCVCVVGDATRLE